MYFSSKVRSLSLLLTLLGALQGCATVTGSSHQTLAVETVTADRKFITDVHCKLSNDKGTWNVTTPNSVMVQKSASDLIVTCNKPKHEPGVLRAISRAGAGMWGNVILGGGIGAVIDHSKGTAYNYPIVLKVTMGESNTLPEPRKSSKKAN